MFCPNCGTESRPGSKFCRKCGNALPTLSGSPDAEPTPSYQPPPVAPTAQTPEPEYRQETPYQKPAIDYDQTPAYPLEDYDRVKPKKKRPVWLYVIITIGVLLVIAAVFVLVFLVLPKGEDLVLLGRGDTANYFESVYLLENDQFEDFDSVSGNRYLTRPMNFLGEDNYYRSPDGKKLILYECSEDGCDLRLYESNGEEIKDYPISADDYNIELLGLFAGFSPNSDYFAFLSIEEENEDRIDTYIIDMEGEIVLELQDKMFASFTDDSKGVIVQNYNWDDYYVDRIEYIDLDTGDIRQLSGDEMEDNSADLFSNPFLTSKGDYVYYSIGDEIYRVDLNGEKPESYFRCLTDDCMAYFAHEAAHIVVIEEGVTGLATLIDINNDKENEIEDIYLGMSIYDEEYPKDDTIVFSSDGRYMLYQVDNDGIAVLMLSDPQGNDEIEIADADFFHYQFSPDDKKLGFIGVNPDSGDGWFGDLSVIDVDGDNEVRLDRDVSSFTFSSDGKYVYYVKFNQLGDSTIESEIYKIRTDGSNKELIIGPEDGWYSFLKQSVTNQIKSIEICSRFHITERRLA